MKDSCKVVVVDTGIDCKSIFFQNTKFSGVSIKRNKNSNNNYEICCYSAENTCIQDTIGHGTAVCGIISLHNAKIELYIVKIFYADSLDADEDLLCYALEYISENIECDIINMSLGLCVLENYDRLYNLCAKLRKQGKYIVSAFENNGSISYPAAFDNVIGVTGGSLCYKNNDFYCINNSVANKCAKGGMQKLRWLNNVNLTGYGNSYACAHFCGIISNAVISETDIDSYIKDKCKSEIDINCLYENNFADNPVYKYKKAVVFPFNKEIHSLVRFSNMLGFDLVDVYDMKYSACVNSLTNTILNEDWHRNYRINGKMPIDWDSFDTFILGHIDEYFEIVNITEYKKVLIESVLRHGKYIYSFDDLSDLNLPEKYKDMIYYPKVTKMNVPPSPFGKLYRQEKPVLGIFGTSSKQGKFSLQLKIRYELLKRNYKIMQIGTEPSSLLYGMDLVFPLGYNSSVYINRRDTVQYINYAMNLLSANKDLIIVGGQSGVVMRDDGNLDNYNFSQVDFLYATLPDAVILCINPNDSIEIIKRTIGFLEACVDSRVIALAVYPFQFRNDTGSYTQLRPLSQDSFINLKNDLQSVFKIPVLLMSETQDIAYLVDNIILGYFS